MADNPVLPTYILPNTPDPAEAVRKNVELAVGIQNARQQQQLHNLQAQEIQQKIAQQKYAQDQITQYHRDLAAAPPTAEGILAVGRLHPEQFEKTHALWADQTASDQKGTVDRLSQIEAAALNGKPDVVAERVGYFASGLENSGRQEQGQQLRDWYARYQKDPATQTKMISAQLLGALGPEKYAANAEQLGKLPAGIRAGIADATTKEHGALPSVLALGDDKTRADIYSARGTGLSARSESSFKDQQTADLKALAPDKLKQSNIATKTAEIEGAQAAPRALATTKKLQGEADSSAAEGKFAEAMRLANLNSSQMDNVLKQFKVINAPQVSAAEASSARAEADKKQADAIVAGEQARTARETADQQLERLKLDNNQVRQNISKLPEPAQARASELTDAGLVDYTAAKNIAAIKDAVADAKAGLGSAGFPADFSSWARTKAGYDGKYEQLKFLYNQLTSDKKLRSASSHGAAAIIALRNTNFPPFSAGRAVIVPLLEKMQAAYQESADVNNIKADFQSQNGGDPDIAKKDFVAGGRIVRAGDRLRDVIERPSKVDEARQIIKKMGKDSPDAKALTAEYAKLGFRL